MTHDNPGVRELWERVNVHLGSHPDLSPVRRAGADPEWCRAAESRLAASMPADLRAWWSLPDVRAEFWIPARGDVFAPVDPDEALETWQIRLRGAAEEGPSAVDENGEAEPRFQAQYLPFAESPGGDGPIVDLRPGTSYGAVFVWDHERWGLGEPLWPSVRATLHDVAVAFDRAQRSAAPVPNPAP